MARRHHLHEPPHDRRVVLSLLPPNKPKGFLGLFAKEKDELFVIDFITPHASLRCSHLGCNSAEVIPLTGRCLDHDAMCQAFVLARTIKAEKNAEKARKKAAAFNSDPEDSRQPFDYWGQASEFDDG